MPANSGENHEDMTGFVAKMLAGALIWTGARKGVRCANAARLRRPGSISAPGAIPAPGSDPRGSWATRQKDPANAAALAAEAGVPVPPQTRRSSGVGSPLELGKAGWKATLRRTAAEVKRDRITLTAAGLAFYWFLSVFPTLVAAIALLNLLHADPKILSAIERIVGIALPEEAARVLTGALSNLGDEPRRASVVTSVVGLALALWSASSGMSAIQIGLNVAYDVPGERPFFRKRLVALVLVAASMLFGGFSVALIIFGQPIGVWMGENLPVGSLFVQLWTAVRWVVALLLLTFLIAVFYYLGPNRPSPNWKWITPGGVLAMMVWVAASLGFSYYVRSFGEYGRTYGSLAGVVILILWLYLAGLAMLLGAELNGELERQSAVRALPAAGG